MNKKEFIKIFSKELSEKEFVRKASSWYLNESGSIKVVNLQKSNHSNLNYLNLSIYIKNIGEGDDELFPKENKCHIRTRLNNKIINEQKDYSYLFDFENTKISQELLENEIKECININILPQLELINSKEGILKIADENPTFLNMLPKKVKDYYNIY